MTDPAPSPVQSPAERPALRPAPAVTLANAEIVLEDTVVRGALRLADGRIEAIDPGRAVPRGAEDCDGQLLIPGLVELHTDNLERHLTPRPGVDWPRPAAVLAHDGEVAAAGITPVFDALRVGVVTGGARRAAGDRLRYARELADSIGALATAGLTRVDHRLHIRAELCSDSVLDELAEFAPEDRVAIVSLMDHAPGQRQFADLSKWYAYYQGKYGMSDAEMAEHLAYTRDLSERLGPEHEAGATGHARRLGARLASHDDTTEAHVARSAALGVGFAEFPTTEEAARACRATGIAVMMGAPNVLRGGSHSGNVAAGTLAGAGLLDILSSDYAPASLLAGAMRLAGATHDLPGAIATVSAAPARAAGLDDRGRLAPGLRADVVRVACHDPAGTTGRGGLGVVTGVWSAGRRVG
ncbi:MAG: alpha-D-ribose 1-methylphosphonate 5-triphosphate diphosphatase [Paracoccaceae bacterium]